MLFLAPKSEAQQLRATLFRTQPMSIGQRTQTINALSDLWAVVTKQDNYRPPAPMMTLAQGAECRSPGLEFLRRSMTSEE